MKIINIILTLLIAIVPYFLVGIFAGMPKNITELISFVVLMTFFLTHMIIYALKFYKWFKSHIKDES